MLEANATRVGENKRRKRDGRQKKSKGRRKLKIAPLGAEIMRANMIAYILRLG